MLNATALLADSIVLEGEKTTLPEARIIPPQDGEDTLGTSAISSGTSSPYFRAWFPHPVRSRRRKPQHLALPARTPYPQVP